MTMWFWTQFWLLLWLKLKGLNIYSSDKNPKSGTYVWLEFSDSKGFPCGSAGKESACNVEDLDLIPRLWRSLGEGKGYPLQYSALENSMDYGPWVHRVRHDWATFTFTSGDSSKELTCQCRRLKRHSFNPWIEKIAWRRAWQPTPIFVPGESFGQGSLRGYRPCIHRVRHDWGNLPHSTHILFVIPLYSSVFSWS